jgi:hypothetical protein
MQESPVAGDVETVGQILGLIFVCNTFALLPLSGADHMHDHDQLQHMHRCRHAAVLTYVYIYVLVVD